ncbi:GNAT family N-acetyltransferase [Myxococcota bacterium]|nr:GNAT family N-acetyltransferase [Myxococcota bacterium]
MAPTLVPLTDAHAAILAPLHVREWRHLYPPGWTVDVAARELLAAPDARGLPRTLVAVDGDDVLGSVSLVADDLPTHPELGPWLASLFVVEAARGRGVGRALVAGIIEEARGLGLTELSLFTESAEGLFARFGFVVVAREHLAGAPITRMHLGLGPREV